MYNIIVSVVLTGSSDLSSIVSSGSIQKEVLLSFLKSLILLIVKSE